jgi:hypothetical protein
MCSGVAVQYTASGDPNGSICTQQVFGSTHGTKTRTSVLLRRDSMEVEKFGPEAHRFFLDHPDKKEQSLLFEYFKMCLHHAQRDGVDLQVTACDGTVKPAVEVIAAVLKFIRERVMSWLHRTSLNGSMIRETDIQWVLTVPAVWTDAAKSLMRQAARNAGLVTDLMSEQLLLCLEPEAAALATLYDMRAARRQGEVLDYRKFLLLDLGGGTVDVTAFEVYRNGTSFREFMPPSGGPFGSNCINEAFLATLRAILTPDLFRLFQERQPADLMELLDKFESKKNEDTVDRHSSSQVMVDLGTGLGEFLTEQGQNLNDLVRHDRLCCSLRMVF